MSVKQSLSVNTNQGLCGIEVLGKERRWSWNFLFAIKNVAIGLDARHPLGGAGGGAAARAPLLQLSDS